MVRLKHKWKMIKDSQAGRTDLNALVCQVDSRGYSIVKFHYIAIINSVSCNRGFSQRGTHPVRAPSRAPCWIFWNNKICFNFVSISFEKIKLTVSERTYIIVPMVQLGFMKFKQQWVRPYFVRSNMAAVSSVTWQILLQWRHMKTFYSA